jgi:hypothetical protein
MVLCASYPILPQLIASFFSMGRIINSFINYEELISIKSSVGARKNISKKKNIRTV